MFALLAVQTVAFAQEPAPPPPPPPPVIVPRPITKAYYNSNDQWQRTDHRARGVYTAGVITAMTGLAFDSVGRVTDSEGVQGFGALAEVVGIPMMAGASLRSARALREQGAQVPRGAGAASWTFWASSFVFNFATIGALEQVPATTTASGEGDGDVTFQATDLSRGLAIGAFVCRTAAYVTASLQTSANNRARGSLVHASLDVPDPRSRVVFAPTFDGRTLGVVVASDAF